MYVALFDQIGHSWRQWRHPGTSENLHSPPLSTQIHIYVVMSFTSAPYEIRPRPITSSFSLFLFLAFLWYVVWLYRHKRKFTFINSKGQLRILINYNRNRLQKTDDDDEVVVCLLSAHTDLFYRHETGRKNRLCLLSRTTLSCVLSIVRKSAKTCRTVVGNNRWNRSVTRPLWNDFFSLARLSYESYDARGILLRLVSTIFSGCPSCTY